MKILDLDLDFFLFQISKSKKGQKRQPESPKMKPWCQKDVRDFLEAKFGLSANKKIPGRKVQEHQELFCVWRDLIWQHKLEIPFDVVHVDAHADLGMEWGSTYLYILGELMNKKVMERYCPLIHPTKGMNQGNWLVFAAACEWLDSLTYIHHHSKEPDDLPPIYFENGDLSTKMIQINGYKIADLKENIFHKKANPVTTGKKIRFERVSPLDYARREQFDYVFLSHSPEYTPQSADALIPIIMEYIEVY